MTGVRRGRPTVGAGDAAELALRCAALLRGGVLPARAVVLACADPPDTRAGGGQRGGGGTGGLGYAGIAERIADGCSPPEALAGCGAPEWRVLAVAWRLAEQSGAPLAPALHRIGTALRGLEQLRARRAVLLAGPRATVRLVSALPPLALLLGALLGFDPVPVLLSSLGAALLAAGTLLLAAGVAWGRALLRQLEREDCVAGIELELVWVALGGGAPPGAAALRAADAIDAFGAEWVPFAAFERSGALAAAVAAAQSTGAPLQRLLLEEAVAARARAQARLEQGAERLGVRVLVPMGVCVLPAFIVLGVLPVLIAMLGA